ncbi:histidine kinase [Mycolicibacterium novocastrense]|uniref:SpoIIE family protein phosphatase n=1 Tax=Mycolicibacterium novocastrense TaxID=59813 RepID=UPI000746427C|nr:SpoIIE family protein phosphatase [Mycolicibacterium novocastrense]KUH69047.1 histidine kinase [Mycolicibacterium novocastrense]KUH69243.1 histidine kinase [Mycolicibacterium novocastrense]KUH71300.1 histidine kinase [Mycolicibacterium novocastrense]
MSDPTGQQNRLTTVFDADGEVGPDMAGVRWAATPLGAPDGWPQSLRTAVSILLSSRFPMWMAWGPDLTFFCNAAYRRDTLGRKYPWALGRPAREVWVEIWPDIGPRIDHVLSTGEATWDSALLLFLERSGYQEETYHTFSYSPLRDDDGLVVGMLCVVSEDTQQVISERQMATLRDLGSDPSVVRTEEEIMAFAERQLGQNLRDLPFTLTYLFDADGGARLAGSTGGIAEHPIAWAHVGAGHDGSWPLEEPARGETTVVALAGDRYADLPTGDWRDPPQHALIVPLQQQGGSPIGFLVAALNRYRPLDDTYRGFVTLVAGHVAAGIGSARNYQAQQQRAEELAELDRAKTAFFSNISHEFRTPLTLILDPVAELRTRGADFDELARDELDIVWRNGLRLAKLVNTLLDFSRIEAGRMRANFAPVDLGGVTAELASVFRSAIERAGLTFTVDCPSLGDTVYIDRDMWEKVIFNLLSNALKFTFTGGISVTVSRDGDEAVVRVSDTGAGVAAAEIPRLFERFHRIENVRARSNEGSGIGLALVKELVELHSGSITADSAEGVGTTFTIRVPIGAAHVPADALASTPDGRTTDPGAEPYLQEALRWLPTDGEGPVPDVPSGVGGPTSSPLAPGSTPRVLIADDNADMREYVARMLRNDGYLVDAVTDGQQALDAVRTELPDVVISDVMMPLLDGLQLVSALRSDPRTAAIPVLLLSARAGQEAAIEGLQAGADDYLVKPFAAAELLARVRANVKLARIRNHHARWRTALIDSLQEAFFVADERGTVIEINAAFTDILGYGVDGLPYESVQPWWPTAESDPDAHRQASEMLAQILREPHGRHTVPVTHRDGHRLWVTLTYNRIEEIDTGRLVMVGTFRDVTAEHYTVQREAALAALNQQLAQADTLDDAVRTTAEVLRQVWCAHRVLAVTFPVDDGTTTIDPSALVCSGEPVQWHDLPAATRLAITSLRTADSLVADASDTGSASIALQHPRGVLVVYLELPERRPFTPEDKTLLAVLAGRLGQGLQRVHLLDQQRETALALQHAILGPTVSSGFAVRYQPAARPLQVGGDWYDVVDLDDGRIALIVGDCVGHGLTAATVMGQLRSACRALLLEHPGPAAALTALDRFAARLPGARCTTAFCAVLNPDTGELLYSSAGHPPPVMVLPDGASRLLDDASVTPLGLPFDHIRPEGRQVMPARATLLLYTDGLVERRRESLDKGIGRAVDVLESHSATGLDDLADEIMTQLAPIQGYQDDVALMLYRQPAPLEIEFSADPAELAGTRSALRKWLVRAGVDPSQTLDVLIATGEALANAIEHGHRDRPGGTVRLRATVLANRLHLTIADTGVWKVPHVDPASHRGRGIALMRALMHDVTIETGDSGTTIDLHARIA